MNELPRLEDLGYTNDLPDEFTVNGIPYIIVPFETMLKCDGEVICCYWLLNQAMKGQYCNKPMLLNVILSVMGSSLTAFNCQSVLRHAKWYVINDGIQHKQ